MAKTCYLHANSVWSSPNIWFDAVGGTTNVTPAAGDTCNLNGFTLTLDADPAIALTWTGTTAITFNTTMSLTGANTWGCPLVVNSGVTLTSSEACVLNSGCTGISGTGTLVVAKAAWQAWAPAASSVIACSITTNVNCHIQANSTMTWGGTVSLTGIVKIAANKTLTITGTLTQSNGYLYGDGAGSSTLAVSAGATVTLTHIASEPGNLITLTIAAGATVTIMGQRVYVSGDSTDPGEANVWTGTSYTINGVAKNGSKVASSITNCSAGNVKSGVAIGDVTGTDKGEDFNSDPGVANVKTGTAWKYLSATNNRTGTMPSGAPGVNRNPLVTCG